METPRMMAVYNFTSLCLLFAVLISNTRGTSPEKNHDRLPVLFRHSFLSMSSNIVLITGISPSYHLKHKSNIYTHHAGLSRKSQHIVERYRSILRAYQNSTKQRLLSVIQKFIMKRSLYKPKRRVKKRAISKEITTATSSKLRTTSHNVTTKKRISSGKIIPISALKTAKALVTSQKTSKSIVKTTKRVSTSRESTTKTLGTTTMRTHRPTTLRKTTTTTHMVTRRGATSRLTTKGKTTVRETPSHRQTPLRRATSHMTLNKPTVSSKRSPHVTTSRKTTQHMTTKRPTSRKIALHITTKRSTPLRKTTLNVTTKSSTTSRKTTPLITYKKPTSSRKNTTNVTTKRPTSRKTALHMTTKRSTPQRKTTLYVTTKSSTAPIKTTPLITYKKPTSSRKNTTNVTNKRPTSQKITFKHKSSEISTPSSNTFHITSQGTMNQTHHIKGPLANIDDNGTERLDLKIIIVISISGTIVIIVIAAVSVRVYRKRFLRRNTKTLKEDDNVVAYNDFDLHPTDHYDHAHAYESNEFPLEGNSGEITPVNKHKTYDVLNLSNDQNDAEYTKLQHQNQDGGHYANYIVNHVYANELKRGQSVDLTIDTDVMYVNFHKKAADPYVNSSSVQRVPT